MINFKYKSLTVDKIQLINILLKINLCFYYMNQKESTDLS